MFAATFKVHDSLHFSPLCMPCHQSLQRSCFKMVFFSSHQPPRRPKTPKLVIYVYTPHQQWPSLIFHCYAISVKICITASYRRTRWQHLNRDATVMRSFAEGILWLYRFTFEKDLKNVSNFSVVCSQLREHKKGERSFHKGANKVDESMLCP